MDYFEKHLFSPIQIKIPPSENLGMIVTIPCYMEPDITGVLDSVETCEVCKDDVEVIVHVNAAEGSSPEIIRKNEKTLDEFNSWNRNRKHKYFLLYSPALPEKHAGVGLARKIAMDEAAFRFAKIKKENGVIVCLDADCKVDGNYLKEIEKHFSVHPTLSACSIYFEHPLHGNDYNHNVFNAISVYELFLRYYILALEWSGFPYPYHTVGSSMAVRSAAYMKVGGMNRRKAGEDFYFLHKLFPFGKFKAINSTRVIPSPRTSSRVPFGTGAAVSKLLLNEHENYSVYNFQTFRDLRYLFNKVPEMQSWKNLSDVEINEGPLSAFLKREKFAENISEIRKHTSNLNSFTKRFFNWFDGFKVLKFAHFSRDHYYPNQPVENSVNELLKTMGYASLSAGKHDLLIQLRRIEKEK